MKKPIDFGEYNMNSFGHYDCWNAVKNAKHLFTQVWLVPDLKQSFISSFNTCFNNLKTTMNDDEDYVVTSNVPGSLFTATTTYVNKMAEFQTLRAVKSTPKALRLTVTVNDTSDIPTNPDTSDIPSATPTTPLTTSLVRPREANGTLMHDRLFHPPAARMRQLGMTFNDKFCEFGILSKQTRTPFLQIQPSDKLTVPLFRVFSDICGPINPISFGNGKYVLTFTDQAAGYSWIYFIPNKASSTILTLFKPWLAMVERQPGRKLLFFFTDGGKEYTGESANTFTTFLKELGIQHNTTPTYSSASNGTAERLNRTLFDMMRPALIKFKLPTPFWAEAQDTANKVRNRLPSKSTANGTSPHKAWFGKNPLFNTFDNSAASLSTGSPIKPSPKTPKQHPDQSNVASSVTSATACIVFGIRNNKKSSFLAMYTS